ncbi:hypothetical protein LTR91_014288 [Friedmanniomyces endolithicus]|uniref:CRIB domain-containing protein n=1 Tax=Friedmanniomyces endolithicus TaxID=329885 RepID=A0AAN6QNQ1_9PEZI|nr:hypothetical protein LTR57_002619 [Friedmanniomyces endolithicus]KAK0953711.1 hypothetical protein LTS01_024256 [Friedmanniomyces endolithicus]KAK0974828.1 hypothetical protein LTR91_014288 [Friedmanniomyces endolithicus]KAK1051166.1 hypothetical protein LTS16_002631 [Friedmanniomyces endolithicus]KAK1076021.1 hypothetical protein LTR33_009314 [Friedmanniomyces endolithicus]
MATPSHPPETPELSHSGERDAPNRRSFFGRALSDAAVRARIPTLHSTMSSQSALPHPPRPETSLSSTRRRKTEPLQQIRDSIFGARKKTAPPASRDVSSPQESWPLPRSDDVGRPGVLLSCDHFRSEQEYYRYLWKNTISPPFNFEHVTHTAKQQLPPVETVHEKDLPRRFWSVSAYQRPKRQLTGIRADDLSEKLPAMGVERGAPSSRPTSPIYVELDTDRPLIAGSMGPVNGIDQTIFDELRNIEPDTTTKMSQSDKTSKPLKHPLRKSSLTTINDQRPVCMSQPPPVQTVTNHATSSAEDNAAVEQPSLCGNNAAQSLHNVTEESEGAQARRPASVIDRSRQPIPALPGQHTPARRSRSSLRQPTPASTSVTSFAPSETISSDRTRRSSQRSSCSTFQSPAISRPYRSSTQTLTSPLMNASWEDDVEFCYQHEAESTCNFDWQDNKRLREPSAAESGGGVRLSTWIAPSPSPTLESSPNARRDSCESQAPAEFRRSVIGHRGFLAARTNSLLMNNKPTAPPNIQVVPPHPDQQVSMLSPVISIAASDGEASAPGLSPTTLHFRNFDSVQRLSSDNLSDPESNSTLSSRNRTSCGSYDSARRTAPTTSTTAAAVAQDTARWSATSSNSIPELMHSERRSRMALQKSTISRPLETLPQSPGNVAEVRKEAIIPRATRELLSLRKSLVMPHRSQSPGDRAAMQGVGRAAPRSRPPTPSRFPPRLVAVDEGRQMVAQRMGEWI